MSSVSPEEGCERCVNQAGLCKRHARGVLPQLAQPGWIRLIGENNGGKDKTDESPEARRIRTRKERKAVRRLARSGGVGLLLSALVA